MIGLGFVAVFGLVTTLAVLFSQSGAVLVATLAAVHEHAAAAWPALSFWVLVFGFYEVVRELRRSR